MTFQVTIMFGLRFVRIFNIYERLIGLLDIWILTSLLV